MIDELQKALEQVQLVPEDEQRVIADLIQQELAAERRWEKLFNDPRSEQVLRDLAREALAEEAAGETEEGGWDVA